MYLRGGLAGGGDGVDLDDGGLPHARREVVRDVLLLDVDAVPYLTCNGTITQMLGSKLSGSKAPPSLQTVLGDAHSILNYYLCIF